MRAHPLLQVVVPGEVVKRLPQTGVVRIGSGLQQDGDALVAIKAGVLRKTTNGKIWVESRQRRYYIFPFICKFLD